MKIENYRNFNKYLSKRGYLNIERLISHDVNSKEIEVISINTPCELNIPFELTRIFDWNDLSNTERVSVEIINAKHRGRRSRYVTFRTYMFLDFEIQKMVKYNGYKK